MNLAYHCSNTYLYALSASVVSVLENNKDVDKIDVYVIEDHFSEENKQNMKQLVGRYGRNLHFTPMPDVEKQYGFKINVIKKRWITTSYCRLLLGSLLPKELDRVLYLDCDTICDGNLMQLYNTDLGDCYCAGVADCIGENYYYLFGMNEHSVYCNSGMILIDLVKWRENKVENAVVEYVNMHNGYVFFMEQSTWNIVLQERIKILPLKYNTYSLISALSYKNLYRLRRCKRFYSLEEFEEAKTHPVILHLTNFFAIKGRAWTKGNTHPMKYLYEKYSKLTPWKDEEIIANDKLIFIIARQIFKFMPDCIWTSMIGVLYENIRMRLILRKQRKIYV